VGHPPPAPRLLAHRSSAGTAASLRRASARPGSRGPGTEAASIRARSRPAAESPMPVRT